MKQFEQGEIGRVFFLKQIAALTLKAEKAAFRTVVDDEAESPKENESKNDSEDSLSETRPEPIE